MIKQFSVKNYKALESVSIPLTPIHVVIGQNDSGKTSLLKAIHAFCSSTQGPLVDAFPGMWTGRELVHFGADQPVVELCASVVGNGEVLLKYELGVEFPILSDHSCKPAHERIALGDGKMQEVVLSVLTSSAHGRDVSGSMKEVVLSVLPSVSTGTTFVEYCRHHEIPAHLPESQKASSLRFVSEQVGPSSFYRLDARVMAIPAALEPSRRFRMERDGFGLPTLLDDISGYDPERFIALKNEFCEYFPEFRTIHLQTELAATRTHQALGLYQSGVAPGKGIYFETRAGATVRAQQASDGAILFLGFLSLFYLPTPPKVLLIEEPETGVYPKRLNQIIDILRKMVGSPFNEKLPQIVFTTHSPYVLTTFKPEEVTFMSKRNGSVVARPLRDAPHIDERLGDGEFYLGELWYNLDEEELFQDAGRPSGA